MNTAPGALPSFLPAPAQLAELRRLELRTRKRIDATLLGSYRSAFRGTGLSFSDLREYQPGDDVKHIHWKATARTDKVYVKSYEEDRLIQVMLAIDVSSSTSPGAPRSKQRRALEFAALVAMLAYEGQDAAGLCLFSDRVERFLPPRRSRHHLLRLSAEVMQPRTLVPATDIAAALNYLRRHQRRSSVLFLISDFIAPPFQQELRFLAFKHDVVCVFLDDRLEANLPQAGIVEFVDAETGARTEVDTSDKRVRARLTEQHAQRVKELSQTAGACGADFIRIEDNPLTPLVELMRRRVRRTR